MSTEKLTRRQQRERAQRFIDTLEAVSYTHLMGAYSPAPVVTDEVHQRTMDRIIWPTVKGMAAEGNTYTCLLYTSAGRNLPDKEFRYLRTVIVTAAVYRGFDQELLLTDNPIN